MRVSDQPQYPPPESGEPWPPQPGYGQQPGYGYPPPGYPPPGYPPPGYGPGYGYPPAGSPPPSRIGWAITALILFWPLAIPAFIYSSRVESTWYRGDYLGAERASANARTCGIVALVIGIVGALLFLLPVAVFFDFSSSSCVDQFGNSC